MMPLGPTRRELMRSGFTFIEILATLAIVAIVLPSVMHGLSLCLATADQARHEAQAASLAKDKLSELVSANQLQQAALNGDFGTDWPGYRWEASVSNYDGASLTQLDVSVIWQQAGKDHTVALRP